MIQSTPSILVMPLLCCLVMLLVNVITVVVAAADTRTALIFAREGNVKLAEAFNVLYDTESVAMVEQRESVEAVSWELQNRLVTDGNKARGGRSVFTVSLRRELLPVCCYLLVADDTPPLGYLGTGRVDTPASPVNPLARMEEPGGAFALPLRCSLLSNPRLCIPVRTRLSWLTTLHTDGRVRRCVCRCCQFCAHSSGRWCSIRSFRGWKTASMELCTT